VVNSPGRLSAADESVGRTDLTGYTVLDLGSLRVPMPVGARPRLMDEDGHASDAVFVTLPSGRVRLSVLAVPRGIRLWPDMSEEIAAAQSAAGAEVTSEWGEWGWELLIADDGGLNRVIGLDGPRWMLLGRATWPADAVSGPAETMREMMRGSVVVRGDDAVPARAPLPLTSAVQSAEEGAAQTGPYHSVVRLVERAPTASPAAGPVPGRAGGAAAGAAAAGGAAAGGAAAGGAAAGGVSAGGVSAGGVSAGGVSGPATGWTEPPGRGDAPAGVETGPRRRRPGGRVAVLAAAGVAAVVLGAVGAWAVTGHVVRGGEPEAAPAATTVAGPDGQAPAEVSAVPPPAVPPAVSPAVPPVAASPAPDVRDSPARRTPAVAPHAARVPAPSTHTPSTRAPVTHRQDGAGSPGHHGPSSSRSRGQSSGGDTHRHDRGPVDSRPLPRGDDHPTLSPNSLPDDLFGDDGIRPDDPFGDDGSMPDDRPGDDGISPDDLFGDDLPDHLGGVAPRRR
jgi:hypothetical protein